MLQGGESIERTYNVCVFIAHSVNLSPCWGGWKKSIEYVSIVLMCVVVFSAKILVVESCGSYLRVCWGGWREYQIRTYRLYQCVCFQRKY